MSIISSENNYVIFPMWIFKSEISYGGSFLMWNSSNDFFLCSYICSFTYEISNAIFHIWKSHVKSIIWTFTLEIPQFINMSHVELHMWNFTCEILHVKSHMWKTSHTRISHVKFHMWNFTCEISHVKNIVTWETHGFWDSHVLLELHKWITCEPHVKHITIFCKGCSNVMFFSAPRTTPPPPHPRNTLH